MEEKIKRGRTYIALVLDRSGSMQSVKQQTINGYNEQVQMLREEAHNPDRSETYVSLLTFNTRVSTELQNTPIEALREMTAEHYVPNGGTAMLDAVGHTIDMLCTETDPSDEYNSYLVVIISDGEELNSQVWTRQQLAGRINDLQSTNRWTFTYIGSNQDLSKVQELGLHHGNTMSYASTPVGTMSAFSSNAQQMRKFMKSRSEGKMSSADFYEGAKDAEELLSKNKEAEMLHMNMGKVADDTTT